MKALIYSKDKSNTFKIDPLPKPEINSDQLLVRTHAIGINRADILQKQGKYDPPAGVTDVLGIEISGEVVAIGNQVTEFALGDKVFGIVPGGAYAEYCAIDQDVAVKVPDDWTYIMAAAVPEAFSIAYEALCTLGALKKDQTVLIHAGGSSVGTAAIQIAKSLGAYVIFTAGSDNKLQSGLSLGADMGVNYKAQDFYEFMIQKKLNVDLILDCVGADYFNKNISLLKTKGSLILIGLLSGNKVDFDLSKILMKHLTIKGTTLRSRSKIEKKILTQNFKEFCLPLLINKKCSTVIDSVYPLEEMYLAHQRLETNLNFGKIVVECNWT